MPEAESWLKTSFLLLLVLPIVLSGYRWGKPGAYGFVLGAWALLAYMALRAESWQIGFALSWSQAAAAGIILLLVAFFGSRVSEERIEERKGRELLKSAARFLRGLEAGTGPAEASEVLQQILKTLQKFLRAKVAFIGFLNDEENILNLQIQAGPEEEARKLRDALASGWRGTPLARVFHDRQSILVCRARDLTVAERIPGIASMAAVPLLERGKALGVLLAGSDRERAFTRFDLELVGALADLCLPAFGQVSSFERVRKKRVDVAALARNMTQTDVLDELAVARTVQTRMLPSELPVVEGVELAARLIPAKEVGGDFYDCFLLREGALAINLGDVSGKSIPAALLVSMAKFIFRFPPSLYIRPSKLMETANKMVCMNGGGMFISDCFAMLDLTRRQLVYVNAGHPPLLHYRGKTDEVVFLPSTGIILGVSDDSRYREEAVMLSSGDLVMFYSDGLTEIKMPGGKVFGEENLARLFKRFKHLTPADLLEELFQEILSLYQEQPRDDLACVVLKIA